MTTETTYARNHSEENQWIETSAREVKAAKENDRECSKDRLLGTTYLAATPVLIVADYFVAQHAIRIPLLNADGLLADEWWWSTSISALQVAAMLAVFKVALDLGGSKTQATMIIAGVTLATLSLLGLAGTAFSYEYIDALPVETLGATGFSFDPVAQTLSEEVSSTAKVRSVIEQFVQPIALGMSKLSLVALPLVAALLIHVGLPRVQAANAARKHLAEANESYENLVSHLEELEEQETFEAEHFTEEAKRRRRYEKTVVETEKRASNHEGMVDALITAELARNPNN